MSETIHLHGGPWDGRAMAWRGGDYLEVEVMPAVQTRLAEPSGSGPEPRRHVYRRSVISRDVFLHQP